VAEVARDTSTGNSDAPATAVSFKTQILPLLKANCVSCHGPTAQNMGVRVDTYANVKASLQSVTDVLVNGGMPPSGPLPDADRQLFQTWVDQGALNN
jgi:mono/diheme cytochrome c family protein